MLGHGLSLSKSCKFLPLQTCIKVHKRITFGLEKSVAALLHDFLYSGFLFEGADGALDGPFVVVIGRGGEKILLVLETTVYHVFPLTV